MPPRVSRFLLPVLVALSLVAILLPWLLGPGAERLTGSNVPPDPFASRLDARQGMEAIPQTGAGPGLEDLLPQFAPSEAEPAQPPLPTVRLWLVSLGPFADRGEAERVREALVQAGIPAAVEAAEAGDAWWVMSGPESDPRAAADLLRRARAASGAEGRVEPLE